MRTLQYLHAAWSADDVYCVWALGKPELMDKMNASREEWEQRMDVPESGDLPMDDLF